VGWAIIVRKTALMAPLGRQALSNNNDLIIMPLFILKKYANSESNSCTTFLNPVLNAYV
jgi:hypothetical protein